MRRKTTESILVEVKRLTDKEISRRLSEATEDERAEVCQEASLEVLEKIEELRKSPNPKAFLHSIARSAVSAEIKRRMRARNNFGTAIEEIEDSPPLHILEKRHLENPESLAHKIETIERIGINRIRPAHRDLLRKLKRERPKKYTNKGRASRLVKRAKRKAKQQTRRCRDFKIAKNIVLRLDFADAVAAALDACIRDGQTPPTFKEVIGWPEVKKSLKEHRSVRWMLAQARPVYEERDLSQLLPRVGAPSKDPS